MEAGGGGRVMKHDIGGEGGPITYARWGGAREREMRGGGTHHYSQWYTRSDGINVQGFCVLRVVFFLGAGRSVPFGLIDWFAFSAE